MVRIDTIEKQEKILVDDECETSGGRDTYETRYQAFVESVEAFVAHGFSNNVQDVRVRLVLVLDASAHQLKRIRARHG